MSAAHQLFERIPLRPPSSKSADAQYGAFETASDPGNKSGRNSIGGSTTMPSMPELRRFSSSTGVPVDSLLPADDVPSRRDVRSGSVDEFTGEVVPPEAKLSNITKALRTGRQRKKTAARTKGGEFQARRKKRRVYFCCISNDIDVEKLVDEFQVPHFGMTGKIYDEVLHLAMTRESAKARSGEKHEGDGKTAAAAGIEISRLDSDNSANSDTVANPLQSWNSNSFFPVRQPVIRHTHPSFEVSYREGTLLNDFDGEHANSGNVRYPPSGGEALSYQASYEEDGYPSANEGDFSPVGREEIGIADVSAPVTGSIAGHPISDTEHSKEVFVFGFGAAVFWGLAKSEVQDLLQFIAQFIVKDRLSTGTQALCGHDIGCVPRWDSTVSTTFFMPVSSAYYSRHVPQIMHVQRSSGRARTTWRS
jgi:uncharacterized Rmd1/YagE family protein